MGVVLRQFSANLSDGRVIAAKRCHTHRMPCATRETWQKTSKFNGQERGNQMQRIPDKHTFHPGPEPVNL